MPRPRPSGGLPGRALPTRRDACTTTGCAQASVVSRPAAGPLPRPPSRCTTPVPAGSHRYATSTRPPAVAASRGATWLPVPSGRSAGRARTSRRCPSTSPRTRARHLRSERCQATVTRPPAATTLGAGRPLPPSRRVADDGARARRRPTPARRSSGRGRGRQERQVSVSTCGLGSARCGTRRSRGRRAARPARGCGSESVPEAEMGETRRGWHHVPPAVRGVDQVDRGVPAGAAAARHPRRELGVRDVDAAGRAVDRDRGLDGSVVVAPVVDRQRRVRTARRRSSEAEKKTPALPRAEAAARAGSSTSRRR